ncbi:MAG: chromosome segregation protein SMC [Firmicutes bacterium]|nr:chromosome segregation protein SMC [Bacillota bacterium]
MYFKRMELNGFKSFADPVTIEFTEGITCIVGPNGSGKSNISDAIRWVLGEQSPKSLRGGKMEDVIFAGTQNRRAKGMAEVTLVIDNSERILPIDFAEVGITRRMYRSGASEYMINRVPCRLRDIRELIMDTGIGVEGYSIIGQGKIADIVSNRMDSRREIFEEAAGIVKYRSKKADTEKSLENAKLNLDRVNDIVLEIEGRIDGLAEESKKAAEYLELREKYRNVEINVLLKSIETSDSRTEAVKTQLSEIEGLIEELHEKRDSLDESLRGMRDDVRTVENETASVRDELTRVSDEIRSITSSRELNKERTASIERDISRIELEISGIDEKLAKQDQLMTIVSDRLRSASKDREQALGSLKEKEEAEAAASEALRERQQENSALKDRAFSLSTKIAGLKAEAASSENLRQSLVRRIERLSEDAGARSGAAEELRSSIADAEKTLSEKQELENDLKKKLLFQADLIDEASKARKEASARAGELRVAAGRLTAREKLLDELERSYEGYGGGVRFLMDRKLPGIIGVLGDLIKVPQGWELAIETVLGAKMQDIVCERDSDAKRAIDLLKRNQAGRLTFLPVNDLRVQRPADTSSVENMRGFLGLASDKVRCRGGYQNIIDYMLGRVVICDDLDHAMAMSRRNDSGLRFVTLDGEIINAAGAMTGGSFKNNTANILTRRAEKESLRKQISQNAAGIKKAEDDLADADESMTALMSERDALAAELSERQTDTALQKRELDSLRQQLSDAESSDASRRREISELEVESARAAGARDQSLAKQQQAEEEENDVRAKLDSLASVLTGLEKAAADARDALTAARLSESEAALRYTSTEERLASLKDSESELISEKAAKNGELERQKLLLGQTGAFFEGSEEALAEKQKEKDALEEKLRACEEKRRALTEKSDRSDDERRKLDSQLYDRQMEKHDADLRLARFESQTDAFKDKLYEEFGLSYAQAFELSDPEFVMSRGVKESREFRDRIRQLGEVSIKAIDEYREVKERYDFLSAQKADILKAIDELNTVIDDTDALIKARFKESFDKVVDNFEVCFKELFKGGSARLSLEDPEHPMESAIEIEAQPPGKKLQNINLLSGGEKTMTAIALMFAVLRSKPTPFCILDEVEAALDENNIECFASYLRKFTDTQFALVTHQKATMEHADVMYGVTMPEHGVSKVLSLRVGDDLPL